MSTNENVYPFKTKPYTHQLEAFLLSRQRANFALFTEMGTGKSKILIDTVAFQFDDEAINAYVVIAPKSVYGNWYHNEIPKHMPEHIPYDMAMWTSTPNKEQKAAMAKVFKASPDRLSIFIMNVEALATSRGQDALYTFVKTHYNKVRIDVDESTTIKNPNAKRTKALIKLAKFAKVRRIASGSPITRNPLDLYSQCMFLDPSLLGYTSFFAFRNRFAITVDMDMGGRRFKKITGFKNLTELQERLSRFSLRLTKKECLDLPEKIYTTRTVELTPEQKKLYQQMKTECFAILDNGDVITAQNVLTQILRLHQVVCGHVGTAGEMHEVKNNRLNELMDVLEEVDGKVIVWANYRADIKRIMAAVTERFGSDAAVSFFGDTSTDERKRAVDQFQDTGSKVWIFVGNPQTGGFGLTLTAANTVVYYSNNYNLEYRLQSEDRPHRIGQKNPVTYIDFVSPDTIDEKIVKALREKKSIADTVIDNWRELI